MSEEKLNSNKLDIEAKRQSFKAEEDNRETYKQISEDIALDQAVGGEAVKNNCTMVRENGESLQDGADEKMLGSDDKENLALKNIEVKFISGDQNQNGDAKIEIGGGDKAFTGMTKEELMKYANDPFWIRLRWFLFIFFWLLWIGMFLGSIAIIVYAPKCAAPTPLAWYKKGPLVKIEAEPDQQTIEKMKEFNVQGVIYELPAHETYFVDSANVQDKIKGIVEKYNAKDIHVIIDLTPNYVTGNDELFKEAIKVPPEPESLSAFVTHDTELNWKKVDGNVSAWKKEGNKFFLSQFEQYYDIRLDNPKAQNKFINVLTNLAELGVKGFRLSNAKYFKVDDIFKDEEPIRDTPNDAGLNDYAFYQHKHTTYVEGIGDLLQIFSKHIHNVTNGEGFLTIKDDMSGHPDVFRPRDLSGFPFELPRFGFVNRYLKSPDNKSLRHLYNEFANLNTTLPEIMSTAWMQLPYSKANFENLDGSAFVMFISLLRGVQIAPFGDLVYFANNSTETFTKLEEARKSQVFQHGSFDFFISQDDNAFAYSRIKSGNPGYFVVINPSNNSIKANFTTNAVASELSVFMTSNNFAEAPIKGKVLINNIEMPKQSTAIFTFVPK